MRHAEQSTMWKIGLELVFIGIEIKADVSGNVMLSHCISSIN